MEMEQHLGIGFFVFFCIDCVRGAQRVKILPVDVKWLGE